ncbi:hypothetical protein [Methylobacterium gregans]|uniref:hypothetical protein n=1 Tax=Methylobacterium gregans TaxID=374424 RepID=UPI0036238993
MTELALDPTETRQPRTAAQSKPPGGPLGRIALASALGIAGLGAFAAASAFMSDLTGSRSTARPPVVAKQSAADWPDLMKDGLPALATGSLPEAGAPGRSPCRRPMRRPRSRPPGARRDRRPSRYRPSRRSRWPRSSRPSHARPARLRR